MVAENDDEMEANGTTVDGPVLGGGKHIRGLGVRVRLDRGGRAQSYFATPPDGRAWFLFCLVVPPLKNTGTAEGTIL